MQILSIKFKNLNSLYGEWSIDFTDPRYLDNGIFLISGPTGAGKTTILDAICLALYRQTPRLGKISDGNNEIMSKNSDSCYAEILFEVEGGVYRSRFEQKLTRKRDKLSTPSHVLTHLEDTSQQWEKLTEVDAKIVELTGMDFKRFTQTVMLAQGQFDAFLKANMTEKSNILEQVTGTEIYANISIAVHKRNAEELRKIEMLKGELGQIELLSDEDEMELRKEVKDAEIVTGGLRRQRDYCQKQTTDLEKLNVLKGEVDSIEKKKVVSEEEWANTKADRDRYDASIQALEVEPLYIAQQSMRNVLKQDNDKLETHKVTTKGLDSEDKRLGEEVKSKEEELNIIKSDKVKFKELSKNIITLDNEIENLKRSTQKSNEDLAEWATQKDSLSASIKEYTEEINSADIDINLLNDTIKYKNLPTKYLYLKDALEKYCKDISAKQQYIGELDKINAEISDDKVESARHTKEIDLGMEKQKMLVQELLVAEGSIKITLGKFSSIDGLTVAYEDAKSNEDALRDNINISDIRSLLVSGEACPVCGSTEHPSIMAYEFSDEDGGLTEVSQVVKDFESRIALYRKGTDNLNKLQRDKLSSDNVINTAELTLKNAKQRLENNFKQLAEYEKLKDNVKSNKERLISELKEFEILSLDDALSVLTNKFNLYQNSEEKLTTAQQNKTVAEGKKHKDDAKLDIIQKEIDKLDSTTKNTTKIHGKMSAERFKLFADKVVQDESDRYNKLHDDQNNALNELNIKSNSVKMKIDTINNDIKELEEKIFKGSEILEETNVKFVKSLETNLFESETSFLEARLPQGDRIEIKREIDRLRGIVDSNKTVLNSKLDEIDEQIDRVSKFIDTGKLFIDKTIDKTCGARILDEDNNVREMIYKRVNYSIVELTSQEFKSKIAQFDTDIGEHNKNIGMNNQRLDTNSKNQKSMQDKDKALVSQQKVAEGWGRLHSHIGSSDGAKYRRFVQGLAFKLVLNSANVELDKMNSRYRLAQHDGDSIDSALELDVIDLHSLNEVRTVKNVSGGESFIISLALALGLSSMFSNSVNALFLDEGFSTLDEDSLDQVLSALSTLHSSDSLNGKMVGIISHVPALKGSVDLIIEVTPMVGGRSKITVN